MERDNNIQEKLLNTVKAIVAAPKNQWFADELRKALEVPSANFTFGADDKISQIYEYCIEKILRKQAEEFYKDFPLIECKASLIADFIRMESFKRKDNFGDFCLALYQQIECINNTLCKTKILSDITEKMWGYPAYVTKKEGVSIEKKAANSPYQIAHLVFPWKEKETGIPYSIIKSRVPLKDQFAVDKIRIIVYFIGYKAKMKYSDYDNYLEITSLLSDIYSCRNMNHRGSQLNEWDKKIQSKILPLKSFYYYKFMGALAKYVEFIKSGYKYLDEIEKYTKTIPPRQVVFPNSKDNENIDLPQIDKKDLKG